MIRLRTLGSLELRDDAGREHLAVLAQPKRLALFVYLAAAGPAGFHRRDTLLALFWPELDEARGRDALNQALRFLRQALGPAVVVSRGAEEVGVDPVVCWCDVVAFRSAVSAGSYAEALELYRGGLLEGFFAEGAAGFEEWLERERARLRGSAATAARAVAEACEREGKFAAAIAAARRSIELSDADEPAVRELLELLDRVGDRAGAIQTYDAFARRLAAEYEAEPAPETEALIERIRTRRTATRSAAPAPRARREVEVTTQAEASPPSAVEVLPSVESLRRIAGGARRGRFGAVAGLVLLVGAGVGWLGSSLRGSAARNSRATPEPSVAVIPFANVGGDSAEAYFAAGIADELTTTLARIPGLRVSSHRSALALRERGASHGDIARTLKVQNILTGSVRRDGGRLRLTAELSRAGDGTVLWSERYEREPSDVFAVQDEIAQAIADALRARLATDTAVQRVALRGTSNLEAYDLYLRGRYFISRRGVDGVRKAFEYFDRAIEMDTGFARAHAGKAAAASLLTWYAPLSRDSVDIIDDLALSSARRAVSLDSSLAEAHTALGNALVSYRRRAEAERAHRVAIALDPQYAPAHQWLAELLYREGRLDEAMVEIRRAVELDPAAAIHAAVAANIFSVAGRHSEALSFGYRAVELDTTLEIARRFLAQALFFAGRGSEAQRVLARGKRPWDVFYFYVAARNGDRSTADSLRRQFRRLGTRWEPTPNMPLSLRSHWLIWLGVGDPRRALDALEQEAALNRRFMVGGSFADHFFDPIRDSARFHAIVRRLGFDEQRMRWPARRQ